MRLWCENERAFWSEQQNQPREADAGIIKLPAKEIARKLNGYPRGVIPGDAVKPTAFVDVHGDLLYWVACAFKADFTAYVVDYGTFPEQRRRYFAKNDEGLETLARAFPGQTADGQLREEPTFLISDLKTRFFPFVGCVTSSDSRNISQLPSFDGFSDLRSHFGFHITSKTCVAVLASATNSNRPNRMSGYISLSRRLLP